MRAALWFLAAAALSGCASHAHYPFERNVNLDLSNLDLTKTRVQLDIGPGCSDCTKQPATKASLPAGGAPASTLPATAAGPGPEPEAAVEAGTPVYRPVKRPPARLVSRALEGDRAAIVALAHWEEVNR